MLLELYTELLVILAFAWLASAAPTSSLVPDIDTNGFRLAPFEDGYKLSISHPDGTLREETVHEVAPGQLLINGHLKHQFPNDHRTLIVEYKAGANGYVAKYIYGPQFHTVPAPTTSAPPITFAPPPTRPLTVPPPALHGCTLKTCGG